ncbi:hypothetical protein CP973_04510 [Streptomyces albofaciens JCM 4342]|uniref:hypothetical protein n=1 Tax=Streptomyces albofaciens TaxID=66866 RepID=UPI00123C01D8|nr:hypothetical protein [Streptomyces albofaciens]KAA6221334.1 hypothetical protein CP973_04510 [Streptomyces albofaciens JCM 4342]
MLPSVSLLQQIGLAILLAVTIGWAVGQARVVRRHRFEIPRGSGPRPMLGAVPRQTGPAGPPSERVELSAAEREAFAGLVRQLKQLNGDERPERH